MKPRFVLEISYQCEEKRMSCQTPKTICKRPKAIATKVAPVAVSKVVPKPCDPRASVLRATDKIMVCTDNGVKSRILKPITTGCNTGFVQVEQGIVGISQKDRLNIFTFAEQEVGDTRETVEFNTATAEMVLNCGNNWSDLANTYTVPENGIYQIIVTAMVSYSDLGTVVMRIVSSTLGVIGHSSADTDNSIRIQIVVQAMSFLTAGSTILVDFDIFNPLTMFLNSRTLSIVQL